MIGSACADEPPPPLVLDTGVAWDLAEHRRATISDLRYHFELAIPREREADVTGRARIRFHWSDPSGREVVLDFLHPEQVSAVRVNGQESLFRSVNDHVVIDPAHFEAGAENELDLEFIAGNGSLNRSEEFLYTLFVPERARYSLPVFDQPNLKGRFAVTLTVPEGWTAVANGALLRSEPVANQGENDGTTRFAFAESRPLPTYLFAFAAGRFQVATAERNGRVMNLIHRETDQAKVERNLEAIFDLHATALAWLEDYTGIEYPFQKFDFVGIPSFQYGGMEHAGAILYRASSLFLDESATQAQQLGRASLIAHETAHMWFGDLVTMNWFDDVWMKEVFANFMAAKIVHPSFPDIDHDLRFLSHQQSAYEVDRTPGANPIRQPLENLREAGTLYGAIIYQKAPVVMNLLEGMVGEDVFREGLRHYLNAFGYDNATWPDLVEILDVLSPEDVTAWSRVWVEDAGRATIRVERGQGGGLTVGQRDPRGEGRVWPQDLMLMVGGAEGVERIPVRLGGRSSVVQAPSGIGGVRFILPESRSRGYGRFELDPESLEYLLEHVVDVQDVVARGVVWLTLWDAVLEGDVDPQRFVGTLLLGVASESEELNLQRILDFLESAVWRLSTPGQRQAMVPDVEAALWSRLLDASETSVRSALFATYRDVARSPAAVTRLTRIWTGDEAVPGVPLSEADRTTLAYELAVREVEGWDRILTTQGESIENPDRQARFEFVRPALSADPAERERFFEGLRDPRQREQEPWVLTAVSYLHHPLRAEHARAFIRPGLELVEEIQRTGDIFFPKRWLDVTLGGHTSPEAAAIVTGFLDERPDYPPRLRAKVLQSADLLLRASAILGGP